MSLTPRQKRFYIYQFDIWRKADTDLTKDAQPYTRIAEAVPAMYESSPDDANESPLGRTRHDLFITLDKIHFELSTNVQDTDYLQMVSGPGGYNVNQWWAIRGNVQTHGFRANCVEVLAQQVPKLGATPEAYVAP